jgi:ATP-dependent exoDNAse (exonuclease V) beta subunit
VLERPDDEPARADTVAPGLYRRGGTDGFDVTWWDPAALGLDVGAPFGLRREELIAKDVAPEVVADGQRTYLDWQRARAAAHEAGRVPSHVVRTVTEWAASGDLLPVDVVVEVVSLDTVAARPAGPRFGTLVHETLALAPLDADADTVARVVAVRARVLGATADEAAAAREAVVAALAHPLLVEARGAWCRRETPVTLSVGAALVEGVIDCVFATPQGATVIDFKTDRAAGADLDAYRRQVAFYAAAVTAVTDGPVRAVLMQV